MAMDNHDTQARIKELNDLRDRLDTILADPASLHLRGAAFVTAIFREFREQIAMAAADAAQLLLFEQVIDALLGILPVAPGPLGETVQVRAMYAVKRIKEVTLEADLLQRAADAVRVALPEAPGPAGWTVQARAIHARQRIAELEAERERSWVCPRCQAEDNDPDLCESHMDDHARIKKLCELRDRLNAYLADPSSIDLRGASFIAPILSECRNHIANAADDVVQRLFMEQTIDVLRVILPVAPGPLGETVRTRAMHARQRIAELEAERERSWVCPCCRAGDDDPDLCESREESGRVLLARLRAEREAADRALEGVAEVHALAVEERNKALARVAEMEDERDSACGRAGAAVEAELIALDMADRYRKERDEALALSSARLERDDKLIRERDDACEERDRALARVAALEEEIDTMLDIIDHGVDHA
jgi:ribosomal protein L37AE/L43A